MLPALSSLTVDEARAVWARYELCIQGYVCIKGEGKLASWWLCGINGCTYKAKKLKLVHRHLDGACGVGGRQPRKAMPTAWEMDEANAVMTHAGLNGTATSRLQPNAPPFTPKGLTWNQKRAQARAQKKAAKLPSAKAVKLPSAKAAKHPSANAAELPNAKAAKLPMPSVKAAKRPSANAAEMPSAKRPSAASEMTMIAVVLEVARQLGMNTRSIEELVAAGVKMFGPIIGDSPKERLGHLAEQLDIVTGW